MDWTDWLAVIAGAGFCLIIPFDYWLAWSGRLTISLATWLAEEVHPTLILGIAVIGIGLASVLFLGGRNLADSFDGLKIATAAISLISTGHLCTSEGAAIVRRMVYDRS